MSIANNSDATTSLWDVIRREWKLIVTFTLVGLLVGGATSLLLTKRYRAEVVVAASETDPSAVGSASQLAQLAGIAGIGLVANGSGYRQEAVATLRSRETAREFIQSKNIATILDPDDGPNRAGGEAEEAEAVDQWINRVTDFFQRRVLDVREDRRTGMVVVSILWTDPKVAAEWANSFVQLTDDKLRARRKHDTDGNLKLLDEVIARTIAVDLKQTLYRMYQLELEKQMQAQVRGSLFFRIIDPAVPPDRKNYMTPNLKLLIGGGILLGCFAGIGLAVLRPARRQVEP